LRWLEGALPNAALGPAIDAYARRLAREDPERALGWTARIEDDALRNAAYIDIGRGWFERAPDDTRRWLASAGLDAGVAASIQEPAPERPGRARPGAIVLPRESPRAVPADRAVRTSPPSPGPARR
jgi:hypothetical protein